MKKILLIILLAAMLLTACSGKSDPSPDPTPLPTQQTPDSQDPPVIREEFTFERDNFPRMDGSTSTAPLAQAAAAVLLSEPRYAVKELSSDFSRTTQSFRNLANGLCDILIVSEPAPEVFEELRDMDFDIELAPIALDALVFVVNAGNPVDSLTHKQIQDIYTGRITNWSDVGGDDIEIVPFQRNAEAGSQVLMEKLVMNGLEMKAAPSQEIIIASGMGEMIEDMMGFDGTASAIGYTVFFYAEDMGMAEGLKILSVDGISPNAETIRNDEYPFINPYYTVIGANEPTMNPTRILWNWLQSDDGQKLVDLEGYVTIGQQIPTQPPEIIIDVQTNFDVLTHFEPLHSMYTRLHDGAMSELVPSYNYGMLLPYSNAIVFDDGTLHPAKFGLVTADGMVVTDLIYDNVNRAEFIHGGYVSAANDRFPAYSLTVNSQSYDSVSGYYMQRKMAACALDGSWVTPFDYTGIVFTRDVIILYRNETIFDIDVINYNGEHLYNMLDLSWTKSTPDDTGAYMYMNIISDRYAHVRITSRSFAFIDLLTGNAQPTRFIAADPFIEGHAPVGIGIVNSYTILWGLVNTDFRVVIQPKYYNLPYFMYGAAIVERRDRTQYVINAKGETLFNVPNGYWLSHSYEGPTFIMSSEYDTDPYPTYLSSKFEVIKPSEGSQFSHFYYLRYLDNGWYTTGNRDGSLLIYENEEYFFPEIEYISFFNGEYLIYTKEYIDSHGNILSAYGVMTLDGHDIILPEPDVEIIPVIQNDNIEAFIISTRSSWTTPVQNNNSIIYKLVDTKGNIMIQGAGLLTYHESLELYSVQGESHFSWLDRNANPIIVIPFLSSLFD